MWKILSPCCFEPHAYKIFWFDEIPNILDGEMEFAGHYYDAQKGNLQKQTDKEEAKLKPNQRSPSDKRYEA